MRAYHLTAGAQGITVAVGAFDDADHQTVNLSVASAVSTALVVDEIYRVWSSVDCFVRMGNSAVAALTTSVPMTAKIVEYEHILAGENFIAGIVSSGTGVLFITRIK